ncbi:MAG: FHA domain-containing protein, partial [Thermoguttaceae bacterium]
MAHLITTKNDVINEDKYPLVGDTTIIGRHPCCEVVIDFGAVSREHARILHETNGYFIEDLHSRNGTYHNGKAINTRVQLFNGDKIRICDFEFVFIGDPIDQTYARNAISSNSGNHVIIDEDSGKEDSFNITSQINIPSNKVQINSANAEVKLRALIDIGRNLGAALEEVLPQLLDNILRIFRQADCAYILLNNSSNKRLELKAFKHRDPHCNESFRISRSILERVSTTKSAILSDDIGNDSRFDPSESIVSYHIASVMAAPILDADQKECLGVIQVDSRSGDKKFSYNDLDLLVSIAFQMAVAIENAKLHEVVIHDKIMERELAVAHEVQRGLLPLSHPQVEGYEFFDFYQPAKYLGGDYFDYIPLPNDEIAIALGDVSGKGISAALLMAKL